MVSDRKPPNLRQVDGCGNCKHGIVLPDGNVSCCLYPDALLRWYCDYKCNDWEKHDD